MLLMKIGTGASETLLGTLTDDFISAAGGNDTIWAGHGDDFVFGGNGNDRFNPGGLNQTARGFYGEDRVVGGSGDDVFFYQNTMSNVEIWGDGKDGEDVFDGSDHIQSGSGNDRLFGGGNRDNIQAGDGDDFLDGGSAGDWLFGQGGNDVLVGGQGVDVLNGGTGRDFLTGGFGRDTFQFQNRDSRPLSATADHITDFSKSQGDKIEFLFGPIAAAQNYSEFQLNINSDRGDVIFKAALDFASAKLAQSGTYVFVTDGRDGYLFADLDMNGTTETSIIMHGLKSTADFGVDQFV